VGALYGERVTLGQERGPDVDLVVYGDDAYARYETPAGYPVVYDDRRGVFTYALVQDGAFVSSGVPATSSPPRGAVAHAQEAPEVRQAKAAAKLTRRGPPPDDPPAPAVPGPGSTRRPGGTPGAGDTRLPDARGTGGAPPGGQGGQSDRGAPDSRGGRGGGASPGGRRQPDSGTGSRTGPGDTRRPGRGRGSDGSGDGG
jgi:hypothetical protein